jgi:hypothetical protein
VYFSKYEQVIGFLSFHFRLFSHYLNIVVSQDGTAASAVRKIFLEYATLQDAANAERELAGRQFGDSVVEVTHFSEADYSSGNLR